MFYPAQVNFFVLTINFSIDQLINLVFFTFQANCTLKILDLSWNGFSNIGAISLADALKANNTLIELNVW